MHADTVVHLRRARHRHRYRSVSGYKGLGLRVERMPIVVARIAPGDGVLAFRVVGIDVDGQLAEGIRNADMGRHGSRLRTRVLARIERRGGLLWPPLLRHAWLAGRSIWKSRWSGLRRVARWHWLWGILLIQGVDDGILAQ